MALSAALFSAGFNISANAQVGVDTSPSANVYQRTTQSRLNVNFGEPFSIMIPNLRIQSMGGEGSDYGLADFLLRRENVGDSGGAGVDNTNLGANGLLQFGGREMRASDRFHILDQFAVAIATVYVYATGGDFAFAENTGNPAATTGTGEFFLDANFAETTQFAAGLQGFTPVQCAAGYESNDDINCRPIVATCGANAMNDRNDPAMCVCVNSQTHRFVQGSTTECEMIPQNPPSQTSGGESEDSKAAKVIGVVGIGMAVFVIANGGLFSDAFAFSPDFGYNITESGYSANAGGRIDFRKDNWHLYQSADSDFHRNGSLEFRYTSGGEYKGDIWAATFSESVAGETADYNFALSANWTGGIWKISPNYRLHSEYEKGEFTTRNSLNLQSEFRYNNWQIRPTAGFRWENANGFAENARFRIDAVHRF